MDTSEAAPTGEVNSLQKDVRDLRTQLHALNEEKEALFVKKKELGAKIGALAREIREHRLARDDFTTKVRSSKESRTGLNKVIRDKIEAVKELQTKKDEVLKKLSIKEDPLKLRRQIEKINERIETEALSFDKEKELMKVLRDLKRQYESAKEVTTLVDQIAALSKEIDDLKNKANSEHKVLQTDATKSQEKHQAMLDSAKSIEDLRKEDAALEAQIQEKKAKIRELSAQVDQKHGKISELTGEVEYEAEERKKQAQASMRKKLSEKQAMVSEKLKKGMPLTTEDILVLQGMDDGEDLGTD